MEFVTFDRATGEWDHRPYVAALPAIAAELPPGARTFVSDPAHFDFRKYRVGEEELPAATPLCPKDLLLVGIHVDGLTSATDFEARFTFPGYPVDRPDLVIRYEGVTRFLFEDALGRDVAIGSTRLGRWIVDEVVPIRNGVRHRVEFEDGALTIDSFDLEAKWR